MGELECKSEQPPTQSAAKASAGYQWRKAGRLPGRGLRSPHHSNESESDISDTIAHWAPGDSECPSQKLKINRRQPEATTSVGTRTNQPLTLVECDSPLA